MTPKERLLTALAGGIPDHLPATTHHVFDPWLEEYMGGVGRDEYFRQLGLDGIRWTNPIKTDPSRNEWFVDDRTPPDFLEIKQIVSPTWRISVEATPNEKGTLKHYTITTPAGSLEAVLQEAPSTTWVMEPLLKQKSDIEIIQQYQTQPLCDVEAVNRQFEEYGEQGIVRGFIIPSELYGQPGCWQDFCCLRGTEQAIYDTFDDPQWVHQCLQVLLERKLVFARSLEGAKYDILELGGGDASNTVISPKMFQEFVAPYDSQIIEACHQAGQKIAYHTCGGMMLILDDIVAMKPDAMETFTPIDMGGDVDLGKAKKRIGDKVCMIGGFDQGHYLSDCSEGETRKAVRKCFEEAGEGGGYIISPSDHFFEADPNLLRVFADEAKKCTY